MQPEEGCSSTAIGRNLPEPAIDWGNPADRGSVAGSGRFLPAVP